jgi:hypothetical protein
MTTYTLPNGDVLTTEHAASSHGIPVLLVNGTAYGADDMVPANDPNLPADMQWLNQDWARQRVARLDMISPNRNEETKELVWRFIESSTREYIPTGNTNA